MLVALLAWFDEDPALLTQCVESLNGTVDHLVAVDGAYGLFPGGTPRSPEGQAEAIRHAAQMPVDIHVPKRLWEHQLEKREFLFRAGERVTTEDDFFLIIDADETLDPGFPKRELEKVGLVGWLPFTDDHSLIEVQEASDGVRRIMRARRGIKLGPTHGDYRLPDGTWLQCTKDKSLQVEPYVFPTGMTHHRSARSKARVKRQTEFYRARVDSAQELQTCARCDRDATRRVWTNWERVGPDIHGNALELCTLHAQAERNRSLNLAERLGIRRRLRREGIVI